MTQRIFIPIQQWAAEDQPINRIDNYGMQRLTNSELLSIIIGSGCGNQSAVDLAKTLLAKNKQSLREISHRTKRDLSEIRGIGEQKAAKILSALELGKRLLVEKTEDTSALNTASQVYDYLRPWMAGLDREEFWVIYCNRNWRVIQSKQLFIGGLSDVSVDSRIIFRDALLCNAGVIFVAHNHPSGNLQPSKYDDKLTQDLKKAAEIMRYYFADHIIITEEGYYSYNEEGRL